MGRTVGRAGQQPPRAAVRAAVRAALADLEPGERVLVACSGGADSLALLAGTLVVGRELGLLVGAVVVDHQLQAGSAAVAARAAEQARLLGCDDVVVLPVEVMVGPDAGGPEAAARRARYEALAGAAGGEPAAAVLLGHTRDDQAETVLLGLARGSGTRSLAGMGPRQGLFRRPLLDLPRAVTAAAADEAAREDPRLAPWSDPHNEDAAYARVRVRTQALPALEAALGRGVVDALARTARLARADADALDAWADQVWARVRESGGGERAAALRVDALAGPDAGGHPLPKAVVSRVVRRLLLAAGCPAGAVTADHVERVADLLDGPPTRAEVALPGGRRARREGAWVVVRA